MWLLDYSQEASNYALDSHPYNEVVLMAIESLALTSDGLSTEGDYREYAPGYFLWEIAGHLVAFERFVDPPPELYIVFIRPLT
jgi:hypothetical protein